MAKSRRILLLVGLTMILLAGSLSAVNACWAYLSPEELVDQAEVIVIAEIIENTGEVKYRDDGYEIGMVGWQVKATYYLTDDLSQGAQETLNIVTPSNQTSLFYELGSPGDQVLLFLTGQETLAGQAYQPLTPQGVVRISYDEELLSKKEISEGSELWRDVKFLDEFAEEQYAGELQKNLGDLEVQRADVEAPLAEGISAEALSTTTEAQERSLFSEPVALVFPSIFLVGAVWAISRIPR